MSYWLLSVSGAVAFQRYKSRLANSFAGLAAVDFAAVDSAEELLQRLSSVELHNAEVSDVFILSEVRVTDGLDKNVCAGQLTHLTLVDILSLISPELSSFSIDLDRFNSLLESLRVQCEGAADVIFQGELDRKLAEWMGLDFARQSNIPDKDDLLAVWAEQIFDHYCESGAFDESLLMSFSRLFQVVTKYASEASDELTNLVASLEHKSLMLDQKREEIARFNASVEGSAMVFQDKELLALQVEQLEAELEESYREVESAKERAGSIATLMAENRGLSEQVRQVDELKVEAEGEVATLTGLTEELSQRLTEAENELAAVQDKYGPIKSYCDEMEAQLTGYERSMDAQLKAYEELKSAQQTNYHDKVASLNSANQALAERLSSAEVAYEELKSAQQTNYHDKVASLNSANQALAERLSSAEVSMLERISEVDSEKAELMAVNQVFQSQTEIFRSEVKTLLKEKEMVNGMSGTTRIEDVFSKAKISGLAIIGSYSGGGYQDIKLTCANIELGDQRFFKKFSFKLVLQDGQPGLEFRPDEVNPDCLTWLDLCNDDFGYFLPYFPNAVNLIDDRHVKVVESMNSSDRLLVVSIASTLAQALQSADLDDRAGLTSRELRQWRLAALKLKERLEYEAHWMSHGAVYLEEVFSVSGYQHLWLSLDHLLQGRRYFSKFDYKVSVNAGADEALGSSFSLELRQLISGDAPLFAWPTDSSDEAGPLLRVDVAVEDEVARVFVEDELSEEDRKLIAALVSNSRYLIDNLDSQGVDLGRPASDWNAVLGVYDSVVWAQDEMPDQHATEDIAEIAEVEPVLSLQEVYEVDGYGHIAFSVSHPDRGDLVTKFQLKFDGEDADGWVEFRSAEGGDRGLPFDHAVEVAEDEYGELISLRYEDLHQSEFTNSVCREASEADVSLLNAIKQIAETLNDYAELEHSAVWTAKFW